MPLIILSFVINLFVLILFARIVLDYVQIFKPTWTPKGISLFFAESTYIITDPFVNAIRRVVKPIKVGSAYIDFSFIILVFIMQAILYILARVI